MTFIDETLPAPATTYDNNGNTLTKTVGSQVTSYTWDFENRLVSATMPNGAAVNFKYDPFGRRIQKSSSAGTTTYVYDGANILEELDGAGNLLARYTQGMGIDEPLAMRRGGAAYSYEADGLGSITSLSDLSGTIAASYTFGAFGNLAGSSGSIANSYRYTGREYDTESGLDYYRARYYDSSIARFLNEDPLRFASADSSFYSYADANPFNLSDPYGMQAAPAPITAGDPILPGLTGIEGIGSDMLLRDPWGRLYSPDPLSTLGPQPPPAPRPQPPPATRINVKTAAQMTLVKGFETS